MSLNSNTTGLEEILASVNALPEAGAGEPTLQEKTVSPTTAVQNVTPDAGYDGLSKVTVNAMPTATQATPSIAVDANGKITASATQTAGYVAAGTKSATKQLTTKGATTITPSTSAQTAVASGVYTTGAVTVAGDTNLIAGNIKSGVSIFGVAGSYEGSGGGGGSVETCTVTFTTRGMVVPGEGAGTVYYSDGNGAVKSVSYDCTAGTVITVVKNSIIYITAWTSYSSVTNATVIWARYGNGVISIENNATLKFSS